MKNYSMNVYATIKVSSFIYKYIWKANHMQAFCTQIFTEFYALNPS